MTKHICIIEDDANLALTISTILENKGYFVSVFDRFPTMEDLILSEPDLFIIDERLPTIGGHIICIMLRSNLKTKHIPQLLMSASPMLYKYAELGEVNDYIKKPFDLKEFLQKVALLVITNSNGLMDM
ncbi:response regulator [Mucilaginibacter sp.]|uniref:response regulator n=1 Tax=Mucilaginibacter sp. TaxID=1882438 RepID=UPI003D0F105E